MLVEVCLTIKTITKLYGFVFVRMLQTSPSRHMLNKDCTVSVSESVETKLLYSIFPKNLPIRNDFKLTFPIPTITFQITSTTALGSFTTNSSKKILTI